MYLRRERLERWRLLHRSFRSKVSCPDTLLSGKHVEQRFCRFEKEVEALRKELAEATSRMGSTSPGSISQTNSEAGSAWASPDFHTSDLPGGAVPDLDLSSNSSDKSDKKNA